MKKHLLIGLVIAGAAIGTANAQSFSAPVGPTAKQRVERPVTPLPRRATVGAFQRASTGNPVQMLNPRAPAKYYGTPDETVSADRPDQPRSSGRLDNNAFPVTGLILFGIRW